MTTKLDGKDTYFLPLNRGYNDGKGNPPNPTGHKTAYLWTELLTRSSLANILEHFTILIPNDNKTTLSHKTLLFPRFQQLDVVRQLLAHARTNGVGHTYLIQHSAGSGKSHSIAWTAYQLIELYPSADLPDRSADLPLFDSVIVVTDRTVLDKQIRDNIKSFSDVKNIVSHATS